MVISGVICLERPSCLPSHGNCRGNKQVRLGTRINVSRPGRAILVDDGRDPA